MDGFRSDPAFPMACLVEQARANGWERAELDRLAAYGDFYSGNAAAGYQRVMAGRLAERDFPLFMTALVHCYLHNRFEEGYQLVSQFDEAEAEGLDETEYLAMAGYMVVASGRSFDQALGYFDRAIDQGLMSHSLAFNAYPIYFEAGRHERVAQLRQLIQESYADDPEVLYALSYVELARDYYPEGFRLAEARYRMSETGKMMNAHLLNRQRWSGDGAEVAGKQLFIHGEQGYGDLIMMSRYLPLIEAAGASVILDCQHGAIPLLEANFPGCRFVVRDLKRLPDVDFDLWTGIMSLPFYFNTTAGTVPATAGYLRSPVDTLAYWQERAVELAPGPQPKIGLAWSGNPSHNADKRRSLPFDLIAPLVAQNPSYQFFTLQTTVPRSLPGNLINVSEEMVTLADTAALIEQMDLVITVDTSIVHIAGALGKETWLLLPHRYEWRWSLEGENNNWYDSVRVLRQARHGDWQSLLANVFGLLLPVRFPALGAKT